MGTRLIRFPDWPGRLDAFLASVRARAFVWGEHDCGLFTADAVLAMTGTDIAADYRNTYSTAREAVSLRVAADDIAQRFDIKPQAVKLARRGDVVVIEKAFGVCLGRVAAAPASTGLEFPTMRNATAAWRIG